MPNALTGRALILAALLVPSLAAAQTDPVRADPPRDTARPPGMEELAIPSHGARMNGFIYLAQGARQHPTVIFLHGYPGNERNLDLAQAARRAGWNALYFDYRGNWGSGGTFGFGNALDDVGAAIDFLRENRVKFGVDTARIAVVGHSMGAWLALQAAARDPRVTCTAALDAWNLGAFGRGAREHPERDPGAYFRQTTEGEGAPIRANAGEMLRETIDNAERWDYLTLAPQLKSRAVFLAASTRDAEAMRVTLTQRLTAAGATHVRSRHFTDDHGFSAHRIALADELVRWLRTDCAAVQRGSR
ncbi:MAG TPA: alpha/beta fold hydrolase [Longimicrobium sp.]|nr:alpha/beta fold hydrolase [Longimicrobium sp.]